MSLCGVYSAPHALLNSALLNKCCYMVARHQINLNGDKWGHWFRDQLVIYYSVAAAGVSWSKIPKSKDVEDMARLIVEFRAGWRDLHIKRRCFIKKNGVSFVVKTLLFFPLFSSWAVVEFLPVSTSNKPAHQHQELLQTACLGNVIQRKDMFNILVLEFDT